MCVCVFKWIFPFLSKCSHTTLLLVEFIANVNSKIQWFSVSFPHLWRRTIENSTHWQTADSNTSSFLSLMPLSQPKSTIQGFSLTNSRELRLEGSKTVMFWATLTIYSIAGSLALASREVEGAWYCCSFLFDFKNPVWVNRILAASKLCLYNLVFNDQATVSEMYMNDVDENGEWKGNETAVSEEHSPN